jgi:hypothetical protein
MGSMEQETRSAGVMSAAMTALVASVAVVALLWACRCLVSVVAAAATDRPSGPAGPLLTVAACLAALVCGRLALAALACAGYGLVSFVGLTGCRPARSACARMALAASPAVLRPLIAVLVAGGITMSSAGMASAASGVGAPVTVQPVRPATSTSPDVGATRPQLPDPGWTTTWTPARPAAPPRAQPDVSVVAAPALRGDEAAPVVVRRGDTLWAIAARQLGPGATDADIAEQWPRWWRANQARIGDDPDRLLPGQVLVAPATGGTR